MVAEQRQMANFKELKSMGYTEKSIYEDLGNAAFLSKNYPAAYFWYSKLRNLSDDGSLEKNFAKRFTYVKDRLEGSTLENPDIEENLTELILEDYQMTDAFRGPRRETTFRAEFKPISFDAISGGVAEHSYGMQNAPGGEGTYQPPVSISPDGNTAYFSKVSSVKPSTGIFSKKSKVHKIYRADKVNGDWARITELVLCPNDYSAKDPALSPDGKQLFFASDMPGSYGDFDIYVSRIGPDGHAGVALNLGQKVNTSAKEVFPKMLEKGTLVFASDGHAGYGGLDVFRVAVGDHHLGIATNLGHTVNSGADDFSLHLLDEGKRAYVYTNGSGTSKNRKLLTLRPLFQDRASEVSEYRSLEAYNGGGVQYSTSVFEEE